MIAIIMNPTPAANNTMTTGSIKLFNDVTAFECNCWKCSATFSIINARWPVTSLKSLIEPAVIVLLAAGVGFIIMAIIVPMFDLYGKL